MPKVCSVEGCDKPAIARGWCKKHYAKLTRYGDPNAHRHRHRANDGTYISVKTKIREYSSYSAMRTRCTNPHHSQYKDYGGRGIKICDRWLGLEGFKHFYEDMGPRPEGCTLDRIDVNGDYCPENCRWADRETQANNKRLRSKNLVTYREQTKSMSEWAKILGVPFYLLNNRISRYHWDIGRAFTTPWTKKPRRRV